MNHDQAVAAFQRKKKGQDMATLKREAYRKVIAEFCEMKFGTLVNGERKKREITQEMIERREQDKKDTAVEVADDLAKFLDIDLGGIA